MPCCKYTPSCSCISDVFSWLKTDNLFLYIMSFFVPSCTYLPSCSRMFVVDLLLSDVFSRLKTDNLFLQILSLFVPCCTYPPSCSCIFDVDLLLSDVSFPGGLLLVFLFAGPLLSMDCTKYPFTMACRYSCFGAVKRILLEHGYSRKDYEIEKQSAGE